MHHRTPSPLLAITVGLILNVAASQGSAQQAVTQPPHPDMPDATHGKQGITHKAILKTELPGAAEREVIVWETEYAPRAINPRHYHAVAITFYVLSGTGIWQEEGKTSATLKAGDSLFIAPGTTHSHWNPSYTEKLRFLEFIVGEKEKAGPVVPPESDSRPSRSN